LLTLPDVDDPTRERWKADETLPRTRPVTRARSHRN
jgi:hypothetical protein